MGHFIITNGYGARTNRPFVTLTEESQDLMIQMSPEEAMDLARNLIEGAEAAIQDAYMIEFLRQLPGVGDYQIIGFLEDFRQWRMKRGKSTPQA